MIQYILKFVFVGVLILWKPSAQADFIQSWINSFSESDLVFQRTKSNVPFVPFAYLDFKHYADKEVETENGLVTFKQSSVSQAAVLPFLVTSRDVIGIGEWLKVSKFESDSTQVESFDVATIGLPMGWLRQVNSDWQISAFAMPIAHKSTQKSSPWEYELMAGSFARYIQTDNLWWAFGFFMDIGHGDDLYLPYVGASWSINNHWTLSAVFPWPALLYAPTADTLFRLGISPAGASWSIEDAQQGKLDLNFDTWDFGVTAEQRLAGNIWGGIEVGVGGLRGFRLDGRELEDPSLDIGASPYINIGIKFRPKVLQ